MHQLLFWYTVLHPKRKQNISDFFSCSPACILSMLRLGGNPEDEEHFPYTGVDEGVTVGSYLCQVGSYSSYTFDTQRTHQDL